MAENKRICRVCGRAYSPCHSPAIASRVFRWQDVTCSPECGAEYLARVMASRGKAAEDTAPARAREESDGTQMPEADAAVGGTVGKTAGRKEKVAE